MEGVDYSFARPSAMGLKAAGKKFAVRYITGQGKSLDSAELAALKSAGLKVGLVFESFGGRALNGYAAGTQDALSARVRAEALGLGDWPVFFAVDFDANDAQKPAIAKYLNGAVSVLGKDHVAVYGSYYVIRYMANHDVCDWFWQTYAWSGGLIWKGKALARLLAGNLQHPSAHLYQYRNGQHVAGGVVDLCRSLVYPCGVDAVTAAPPPWWAKYGPRNKPKWFWPLIAEAARRAAKGAK